MKEQSKDFFPAHYRSIDDTYQTVEEHVNNVSVMARSHGESIGLAVTCELAGLLHDFGKFTLEFRDYFFRSVALQKEGKPPMHSDIDHGKHGAAFVLNRYHDRGGYGKLTAEILSMVICYHHGGMADFVSPSLQIKLLERTQRADETYFFAESTFMERVADVKGLDDLFSEAQKEVAAFYKKLSEGKEKKSIQNMKKSKFMLQLLIKYVYSCLIDADRYDTYLFTADKSDTEHKDCKAIWENFSQRLQQREAELRDKKPQGELEQRVHRLRHEIWEECKTFSSNPTGIYTLTVPTGGGKTFSVLRYAIDHAIAHGKKKIIFVLPFLAILEQNAAEVRNALDAGDLLLEHHSNVCIDLDKEDEEFRAQYRLLTERWDSPIIFTTMVQFLNTFFASGTQNLRRMHSLTDTILIFDEIQALPIKCISLFNETAQFLSSYCRDTIVLCSATQPTLETTKNGLHIDGEMIQCVSERFRDFKRMEVRDERKLRKLTVSQFGEFVWSRAETESSILIILNTKGTAEAVFRELKRDKLDESVHFYFLSTNLCSAHRKTVIRELKEKLKQGERVICVSTQLIEAGVDISFHCVMRHIAGMDSIAQAAGRGNRNGEGTIKYTHIFELEEEKLGSLKEIKLGQQHTREVLNLFQTDPEAFDSDLLSPSAMNRYYGFYFADAQIKMNMDYPIEKEKSSIFVMLSMPGSSTAYREKFTGSCPLMLDFQLKTASQYFEVIDDCTKAVLVPYGEGVNLISKMKAAYSIAEALTFVKKAQQYMVNISEGTHRKLCDNNGLAFFESVGIWILDERFYHDALGVTVEGEEMGLLAY